MIDDVLVSVDVAAKRVVLVAVLLSAAVAIGLAWAAEPATGRVATDTRKLLDWVAFDRLEAERLADEGRLVFVDVTADWCFTCKVNEEAAAHRLSGF